MLLALCVLLAVACIVAVGSTILASETQVLVDNEVTHARVARSEDGEADDDACKIDYDERPALTRGDVALTKGDQLGRDLAKSAQPLRYGVSYQNIPC